MHCRMHKREGKESFSGKSKLMYSIRKTHHFKPKLRSRSHTWHPLSLLWDVCQNGPWHLPIVAAQPRMDVAVPAPSLPFGHSAESWRIHRAPQVPRGLYIAEFAHLGCKKNSPQGPHRDAGGKGRLLLNRPRPAERQTEEKEER